MSLAEYHAADMGILGNVSVFCFLACVVGITLSSTQVPLTLGVSAVAVNCSSVNTTQCTACPQGTFSSNDSDSCVCCDLGFCLALSGCSSCSPGYYQPQTSQWSCLSCPKGFYTNTSKSSECQSCPAGYYANQTASTSCIQCGKGSFSPLDNATSCEPCLPGSFCNMTSCTACTRCPNGQEAVAAGASECSLCRPGTSRGPKDLSCVNCGNGDYQDEWGAERCEECPEAHYCPSPDIHPITCPDDAFCPSGSTAPSYCMETFLKKSGESCVLSALGIFLVVLGSLGVFVLVIYLVWKYKPIIPDRTRRLANYRPFGSRTIILKRHSSSSPLLDEQRSSSNMYVRYERDEHIYAGW